jgi:hypothetical protein
VSHERVPGPRPRTARQSRRKAGDSALRAYVRAREAAGHEDVRRGAIKLVASLLLYDRVQCGRVALLGAIGTKLPWLQLRGISGSGCTKAYLFISIAFLA